MAEPVTERWWYQGRRLLSRGDLGYAWLDAEGEQRAFKRLKAGAVGCAYEVRVSHEGDVISLHGSPVFTDAPKHPHTAEWEAEDRLSYTAEQVRKAEVRAARDGKFGELTLNEVRTMMNKRPMYAAVLLAQFIHYVEGVDRG